MNKTEKNVTYIIIAGLLWWIFTENWSIATYFIGVVVGILTTSFLKD